MPVKDGQATYKHVVVIQGSFITGSASLAAILKASLPSTALESQSPNRIRSSPNHELSAVPSLLLFAIANNFVGLDRFSMEQIMEYLTLQRDTRLLQQIRGASGPEAEALEENLFRAAIESGDARIVESLLQRGIDPNDLVCVVKGPRRTPVERSSELRNLEITRLLIDANADVNKTLGDRGALHCAISASSRAPPRELISLLLDAGAKVGARVLLLVSSNHKDRELMSLLVDFGAKTSYLEWVRCQIPQKITTVFDDETAASLTKKIFEAGADSIYGDSYEFHESMSRTLDIGAGQGKLGLVQLLLNFGVHLTKSTLSHSVKSRNKALIRLILDAGADVNGPPTDIATLSVSGRRETTYLWKAKERSYTTPLAEAIRWGDVEIMDLLKFKGASSQTEEKERFGAALLAASKVGQITIVQRLLNRGHDLKGEDLAEALAVAIWAEQEVIVVMLLDAGAEVNGNCDYGGNNDSALLKALRMKNETLVRSILEADVSFTDEDDSPLVKAAEWGNQAVVEELIATGADVNGRGRSGGDNLTALTVAVRERDYELMQLLFRAGADVNTHDRYPGDRFDLTSATTLSTAVEIADVEMVEHLLSIGAAPDDHQALTASIKRKNLGMVQTLIKAGAQVNHNHLGTGMTALSTAVVSGNVEIVEYLLSIGADPIDQEALDLALPRGIAMIEKLVAGFTGIWRHTRRDYGCVTLQKAILEGDSPLIELLLRAGIDINGLGQRGTLLTCKWSAPSMRTSLSVAIEKDRGPNFTILPWLLEAGGNPNNIVENSKNPKWQPRKTALLAAIDTKSVPKVQLLLDAGAEFNRPATRGVKRTPLQEAAEIGSFEIIQHLLNKGAIVNAPPAVRGGGTALQLAAIGGYVGIAELLLENGADVDAAAARVNGRSALEGAAEHGRIDMVKLLFNAGSKIHGEDSGQYDRALRLAAKNGHMATKRYLEVLYSTSWWPDLKF